MRSGKRMRINRSLEKRIQEINAFSIATKLDSIGSWKGFLFLYPRSRFRHYAQKRLRLLLAMEKEDALFQQQFSGKADDASFHKEEKAFVSDVIFSYPTGRFKNRIKERMLDFHGRWTSWDIIAYMISLCRWAIWATLLVLVYAVYFAATMYLNITQDLPDIQSLKVYEPPIITNVYADDGTKIAEFYKEYRMIRPLSEIPDMVKQAFIAAEDARFYEHKGIDILGIARAMIKNIEAGTIVQGGSTIIQQVTRMFLLSNKRDYERKLKEALLAYRIDKSFSKDEILFLYLNHIYLGLGAYGVEAAARKYFGKSVTDLNLAESALLAGMTPAPSAYCPLTYPKKALERQKYVLHRMVSEGYIRPEQARQAMATEIYIRKQPDLFLQKAPFFAEHVRRYVEKKYGSDRLYKDGLSIYTTVNLAMQASARYQVEKGLRALDKRQGFRGPLSHFDNDEIDSFLEKIRRQYTDRDMKPGTIVKGVVVKKQRQRKLIVDFGVGQGILKPENMRWLTLNQQRRLRKGDVIELRLITKNNQSDLWDLSLEQPPDVQGALLCIETQTGHVKAMIGGWSFATTQFNRAIQSKRQPGSAFKPIIYAAALEKGFTPATLLFDEPFIVKNDSGKTIWKPDNYDHRFLGPILLRNALARSRNVPAIRVLNAIGVDYAIDFAHSLGIDSPLDDKLPLALGASAISLLELIKAYSVFANQGKLVEPVFITRIEDRHGHVLEENTGTQTQIMDEATAYLMTSLLCSVVKNGTGYRVRKLKRPVAGKTGTTNDYRDAWFVGYTPQLVTGVWVGFDHERPLGKGETGSRAASPIWLEFMKDALQDKPIEDFDVPQGIVYAWVDATTGLPAIPNSPGAIKECFKKGTGSKHYMVANSPKNEIPIVTQSEQFFKSDL